MSASSTSTSVVGSLAALDLAHQAQTHPSNPSNPPPQTNHPKVVVQHIDQVASSLTQPPQPQDPTKPSSSPNPSVTLVAIPKTMGWPLIITLMTVGILGLIAVLVYSVVKPGTPGKN